MWTAIINVFIVSANRSIKSNRLNVESAKSDEIAVTLKYNLISAMMQINEATFT